MYNRPAPLTGYCRVSATHDQQTSGKVFTQAKVAHNDRANIGHGFPSMKPSWILVHASPSPLRGTSSTVISSCINRTSLGTNLYSRWGKERRFDGSVLPKSRRPQHSDPCDQRSNPDRLIWDPKRHATTR